MVGYIKTAYTDSRWARPIISVGLLLYAVLLYRFSGGFPPWAWRFSFAVFPQLSRLSAVRGSIIFLPLVGLVLLSLSLFVLWGILVLALIRVGLDSWLVIQKPRFVPSPNSTVRLAVGIESDPGIVRKKAPNEDSVLSVTTTRHVGDRLEHVGLFIVADGMGGHANGLEASCLAVQSIYDAIVPSFPREKQEGEDEMLIELLKDAVHRANLAIYQRNRSRQERDQMGTTVTAALVVGATAYIVNIGDSRTYLYRKGTGLSQVTQDHSLVARLVESGAIKREDIYTHPQRNQIYRCLGDHASVQTDWFKVPLQVNDVLLLCSDGLWEMVRDKDIEEIIRLSTPHTTHLSKLLIQAALCRGGADNVSAIVMTSFCH